MSRAIHQILKTITLGDAISNHTLEIRAILREHGYTSEIFVETCHPKLAGETFSIEDYERYSSAETILIFHFSQGTSLVRKILQLPDQLVLIYHNITPEKYFRRVHHQTWLSLIEGREQLPHLARKAQFGLADSEYNRAELEQAGCLKTGVLPIILQAEQYRLNGHPMVLKMFREKQTTFLFVGRITPNKGHSCILKFFYYYKKLEPSARLIIVGQYYGFEPYFYLLLDLSRKLRLEDVHFVGHVSHQELCTYYSLADLFLCLSFHEGFCVPLVESMLFDLPIIAQSGTAIDDTLHGAGIIFNEFDPLYMAETASFLMKNPTFRQKVIANQRARLQEFNRNVIAASLIKYIQSIEK